jgi:hypothetical protein
MRPLYVVIRRREEAKKHADRHSYPSAVAMGEKWQLHHSRYAVQKNTN